MNSDLRTHLREADPVPREAGLSPDSIAAVRGAVIAAAQAAPPGPVFWGRQFAMAACLVVVVLTGVLTARRVPSVVRDVPDSQPTLVSDQRTQVQFSTPGGTRIIWTLDPGFQLEEAGLRR